MTNTLVRGYAETGHNPVNSYLRDDAANNPVIQAQVDQLDAAMTPLPEDGWAFRSCSWAALPKGWRIRSTVDMIGVTLEDRGYLAASLRAHGRGSDDVTLTLEVPAGHPQATDDQVIILARGSRLIVTDAVRNGDRLNLRARVVTTPTPTLPAPADE